MYKNNTTKTKNSIRNTIWGVALKILGLLFPFIIRTLLIYSLGAEYLGLNSLFTSLLQILSLSELGIGSAMVYYMYEPFVKGDIAKINALLKTYRKVYNYIGLIITCLGLLLLPFLDSFIAGKVPSDINIYILYLIYLANTSVSYFLFSYRRSLFIANQRSDIESKALITSNLVMYVGQVIGLSVFSSYYFYAIVIPLSTILNNILIYYMSRKYYPEIECSGILDKETLSEMKRKVKALFGHKVGGVISTSISNILVSSLLGLSILGVFNNYYFIILLLGGFLDIFFSSIKAGVGYSMVESDRAKNLNDFQFLQFWNAFSVSFCAMCYACLIQPFMENWVGKSLMLDTTSVILFSILFYIWNIRKVCLVYKDAAGNWEKDWLKPYVETAFNVVVGLILAHKWGVHGIIVSSILSMLLIDIPWEFYVLNKTYFRTSFLNLMSSVFKVTFLFVILISGFLFLFSFWENSIWIFVGKIFVCILSSSVIFWILFRKSVFIERILIILSKNQKS